MKPAGRVVSSVYLLSCASDCQSLSPSRTYAASIVQMLSSTMIVLPSIAR